MELSCHVFTSLEKTHFCSNLEILKFSYALYVSTLCIARTKQTVLHENMIKCLKFQSLQLQIVINNIEYYDE